MRILKQAGPDGYPKTARMFGRECRIYNSCGPYLYVLFEGDTKLQRRCRAVWEHYRGEIPKGLHIHHKNGDKHDDRIANMELVTCLDHKFKHGSFKEIEGEMFKTCPDCGRTLHLDGSNFYTYGGRNPALLKRRFFSKCIDCKKKQSRLNARKRAASRA